MLVAPTSSGKRLQAQPQIVLGDPLSPEESSEDGLRAVRGAAFGAVFGGVGWAALAGFAWLAFL
jgi:hypothetical protein